MTIEIRAIAQKMRDTKSPYSAKLAVEEIMGVLATSNDTYKDALQQCLHWETISCNDVLYPIFEAELPDALPSNRYERIKALCDIILFLEG